MCWHLNRTLSSRLRGEGKFRPSSASALPTTHPKARPCPLPSPSTSPSPRIPLACVRALLNNIGFFFLLPSPLRSLRPTVPRSVPPLRADVSGELIIPSSCCLPTTTLFPSCVTAALSPFPSASPCHSRCLCPFRLSLYHVYSPPVSLSSHAFPARLRSHPLFYFPLRQACHEDSSTCP